MARSLSDVHDFEKSFLHNLFVNRKISTNHDVSHCFPKSLGLFGISFPEVLLLTPLTLTPNKESHRVKPLCIENHLTAETQRLQRNRRERLKSLVPTLLRGNAHWYTSAFLPSAGAPKTLGSHAGAWELGEMKQFNLNEYNFRPTGGSRRFLHTMHVRR
jgi:hypothetical protein